MSLFARVRAVWLGTSNNGGRGLTPCPDAARFEDWVRPHLPGWIATARRLLGNLAEAEEVAYQALVKLWLRYQSPGVIDDLAAYGARVVQNTARDHLRTQRRRERGDLEVRAGAEVELEAAQDPLHEVLSREVRTSIDAAVATLPPEDQEIIQLRAFERLTFAQIAKRLAGAHGAARSEEWAKKRYQRAAHKLRHAALRALGGDRS